jgi:hypothetical protein
MSWSDPSWKEAAREYHAARGPGRRMSKAEWEQWRCEAGFKDDSSVAFDGRAADLHRTQETTTPITKF